MRGPLDQTFGDYRLVRLISSGGFADVYEAEHLHLPGIKAAVKLLKGSFTPQQIETLRKEALLVSTLEHPHIVQVRTFSLKDDMPYLVMSYAEGGALHERHPRGTRLLLAEILSYVRQIAQALQYAHQRRIVHRDLKPANLLLTHDGRVQVADFGIAVVMHSSTSRTVQEIAGTWAYMAPEQFHRQAEPASDQYSLAIMVYQWLCGARPFDGNGNVYLIPKQHQSEAPPSLLERLPELAPGVERVVMKALAKSPAERFASIQAFAEALEEASTPPLVSAPGQRLGEYQLIRKIGEGGFAQVYEAVHVHLQTRVAIKLLKGIFSSAQVEALWQEARLILRLEHPHIIRAYGFTIEHHVPYLVLTYATGGSLASRYAQGTRVPLDTIRTYVRQIADALHYAHRQGITHRDLKPENLLLMQDGRVQIADFGMAVMVHAVQGEQEIVGSWLYMAPEQFESKAGPASDQYALAIMVYQWLCGEPPFTGADNLYALPYQHLYEPPPSLSERVPDLSPRIEQVVMKALAKQPSERFFTIQAFAQAFEDACTTSPSATMSLPAITRLTYRHQTGIATVSARSPDGTRVASGGDDATVRIGDAATGQTLFIYRGHTAEVNAMAWSADGQFIASAGEDRTVQVWETTSGALVCKYEGHTAGVNAVAWSPDVHLIASGGSDRTVHVWKVASGLLVSRYEGHTAEVNAVAWSSDGRLIASGGSDHTVQVWEVTSGTLVRSYESTSLGGMA